MPSPDVKPYVDLTLLDLSTDDLVGGAIDTLAARLPGWQPREAATEVMLLETVATVVVELVYAVNRIPGTVLETLLRLYGLTRSLGTPPTVTVEVRAVDALGHTIPAGTRLRLDLELGLEPVTFTLDADLVIAPGDTTGTASATGTAGTPNANGVPAGATLIILDAVPAITATTVTDVAGGSGPEDGASFLERAVPILGRLTDTLVLPDHFTARALEVPPVYRARTLNLYDADTDTADVTGHVTVAVLAAGGNDLTGPQLAALDAILEAQALASLNIHVVNATVTDVNAWAVITVLPGHDPDTVVADVATALTTYLNPDTWGWSDTVRRNELISVADRVDGVDYVVDVLDGPGGDPIADIALTGPANLAAAGVNVGAEVAP